MELSKLTTAKGGTPSRVASSNKADIKQSVANSGRTIKTSTPSETVKISQKAVERGANRTTSRNIEQTLQDVRGEMAKVSVALSGKETDYTINSDNEVIIKIRDRATGEQIKQIPSEESVAAKKAFRQITEKLFDKTI